VQSDERLAFSNHHRSDHANHPAPVRALIEIRTGSCISQGSFGFQAHGRNVADTAATFQALDPTTTARTLSWWELNCVSECFGSTESRGLFVGAPYTQANTPQQENISYKSLFVGEEVERIVPAERESSG
jgi:hypothetical protein